MPKLARPAVDQCTIQIAARPRISQKLRRSSVMPVFYAKQRPCAKTGQNATVDEGMDYANDRAISALPKMGSKTQQPQAYGSLRPSESESPAELAEKKRKRRELLLSAFSVNPWVAEFRNFQNG